MKRNISIGLNIGSLIIILSVYNFWNTLFLFFLVGAIPGTSISLSPLTMLGVIIGLAGLSIYLVAQRINTSRTPGPSLPKKRYGRI